ncbi:hypothetical protein FA13DRAFT_1711903 [Coprinellus micaceus]|uniref:Uncharacterized protein n=1 Tax=Coprinellus micaceus TaxID=71717 RepID=A0A4Y7T2F0_COPMI|nr:hypothetical protein FA13DRAFT_1711903 [Coprinellus micaceus]
MHSRHQLGNRIALCLQPHGRLLNIASPNRRTAFAERTPELRNRYSGTCLILFSKSESRRMVDAALFGEEEVVEYPYPKISGGTRRGTARGAFVMGRLILQIRLKSNSNASTDGFHSAVVFISVSMTRKGACSWEICLEDGRALNPRSTSGTSLAPH